MRYFNRYIPYFLILTFVLLKIQHLNYPFYWDESWPYASAVYTMHANGPSMSPDAIPPDLSRGHPTLFVYLAALWAKVFGLSYVALHSFPLFISVIYAFVISFVTKKLFGAEAAILAILLCIFPSLFFVQSSFVLPEIFLSLLGFLSIYFYAKNNLILFTIFLSAMFFTKETAVVLGFALGILSLLRYLIKDITLREFLYHVLAFSVPVLLYIIFFSYQKYLLGWYFFPYHIGLIDLNVHSIVTKLKAGLSLIFYDDLRIYLLIFAAVSTLLYLAIKRDKYKLKNILTKVKPPFSPQTIFFLSVIMFLPAILIFNSINAYINRYFIVIFLPVYILIAAVIGRSRKHLGNKIYLAAILLIGYVYTITYSRPKGIGDDNLGAFDVMSVEKQMISFMQSRYAHNTPIASNAYILRTQLTDPNTRYLSSTQVFKNVNWEITNETKVAIFSIKEPDYQYEKVKSSKKFKLVKRFEKGRAWAEIYERKFDPLTDL